MYTSMAKKKSKRKSARRNQSHAPLDPVLSRGVLSIILIVFAIVTALALFGEAAKFGELVNAMFGALFGYARYAVPVIMLIFAWFIVRDVDYNYKPTHTFGALLFVLSVSSLFHLHFELADMWPQALEGNGGGIFGMGAKYLKDYLGTVASIVLLVGLAWISLLLIFNTAISQFLAVHQRFLRSLGNIGIGLRNVVASLFVLPEKKHSRSMDDAAGEDDEIDEDELYIEPIAKKSFGHAKDTDEEDDVPEATPAPKMAATKADKDNIKVPLKSSGVDQADYMKNIIIKKSPPTSLLSSERSDPTSGDIKANTELIRRTFADFNINVDMGKVRVGPTVTQYTLKPPSGVKLTKITSLSSNLALALAAHPLRIEAPIPGKSLVGIEVPNEKAAQVTLKELLESKEFKTREHNMMVALGRDVGGKVWFADLPKMPHLLIAGSTGSGKSVCMNTIIMSLLYQNTAESLRFIMVDPKRVELTPYNGIPHLLAPVITDVPKTVNALKWTVGEMDRRFEMLSKVKNKDINTYNAEHPDTKLPHIVFIIDELADLMQMASNEVEGGIIRLAQMARAVGIHIIVATQRPSVDVITGLMKANIPGRIAFSVASSTDSRTILDATGAETLLGKGDMLLSTASLSKPVRIQGAFVSEKEAKNIIKYLHVDDPDGMYDNSIVERADVQGGGTGNMFGGPSDDRDALFNQAKALVIEAGKGSASYLQRRLRVGYARAARLLDELEMAGVVGPSEGSKPREILATEDTIEEEIEATMNTGAELNVFKKPEAATATEEIEVTEQDDRYPDADDDLTEQPAPTEIEEETTQIEADEGENESVAEDKEEENVEEDVTDDLIEENETPEEPETASFLELLTPDVDNDDEEATSEDGVEYDMIEDEEDTEKSDTTESTPPPPRRDLFR
jgi:S-DNA-T family DNA segregation ATPase FtsK/SpoIIIE